MAHILLCREVLKDNYTCQNWKSSFFASRQNDIEKGLVFKKLLHNVVKINELFLIFDVIDLTKTSKMLNNLKSGFSKISQENKFAKGDIVSSESWLLTTDEFSDELTLATFTKAP